MATYQEDLTGKCPHCTTVVRFERARSRFAGNNWQHQTALFLGNEFRERNEITEILLLTTASCPECKRLIITLETSKVADIQGEFAVEKEFLVWPRQGARPVPQEVRDEHLKIAEDYDEAAAVLSMSPKASAALSRRCLQAVLKEKGGANQHKLADQIQAVVPQLPSYIGEYVDAVRVIGNFAAHPSKDKSTGEIVDVEPGEAEWNLDVLDMLFEHYYVMPARNKQKKDTLNTKLTAAGKKPIQ